METMNNPKIGIRDGLPIGLGYFAISFAFGIAATAAGLSIGEAVLISAFNLTSAGQLAALPIIASGGALIELALTQLIINLRYSLMSISLSQRFDKKIRLLDRFPLAFTLTDEIFAVSISHGRPLGRKYLYSALLLPYLGWTGGTLLGAVAGNVLPDIVTKALGVSMYAMFIAIIVPAARKSLPVLLCVLCSVGLSCLFRYVPPLYDNVPSGFVIIIIAVAVSILFAALFPVKDEEQKEEVEGI